MNEKIIPILYDIKKYLNFKKLDYFEIRFEKIKSRNINIENKNVKHYSENENQGIGIRIIIDKKVGFLSINNFSNYKKKIDNLVENTKKTNKKIDFKNYSNIKDKDIIKYKDFEDIESSQKIKELKNINKKYFLKEKNNFKIINSEIIQKEIINEKYFLTNTAEIYQKRPYLINYSLMTGKKNNQIETNLNREGFLGGLEKNKLNTEKLFLENQNTLEELLNSKPCPATISDAILHPSVSDLLTHEAIGHSCEGDAYITNSTVLKKGLKISDNKDINIFDNPEIKSFGYFKYDDEGMKAKKTQLIKNGVVNDFLTNIESATKLKQVSNGSARADGYSSRPIVRMSCTYFEKGKDNLKDMLNNFSGYLLKGFSGGQVDPNIGTFMFGIKQAYKYKNGKIIDKYKQASISGNILKYLYKITEISNKKEDFEIGFCGKEGQTAFVSSFDPYIKIKDITIGGTKHE